MNGPQKAVLFLGEGSPAAGREKPLLLENVLFCPILRWVSDRLRSDGVRHFFVVSGTPHEKEIRACFDEEDDVTVSKDPAPLQAFLETEEPVFVLPGAALPDPEARSGFAYTAQGLDLQTAWSGKAPRAASKRRTVFGWRPIFDPQQIGELALRDRIVQYHRNNGVRILDPSAVYIDPRVEIGEGTLLLPGTILRGKTRIGQDCEIGPQTVVNACTVGDKVTINASQVNESILQNGCDVGPYAHIRPNCTLGADCHIGAFVQLKNCVLGAGTKMAHLTYVGDADVGCRVNFGCGTITTNYDGFRKHRCTVGDDVFVGCNTNLVSPVTVGSGAYIAAGTTVTEDVPPDALAVGRARQENKPEWAARRRERHGKG